MQQTIRDLIDISQYAGNRVDYTQGGGGNTSVKNEKNGIMLIKASGYKLKDISENTAFVAVDQKKILDFYNNVDLKSGKDYEKESGEVAKNSVIAVSGMPALRPSVEVGFHSILKKYVVHTHSVYANLLTCCVKGEEIAEKLYKDCDFGFIFLPYINPGFELTLAMKNGIENYYKKTGKYPEVIFMKNHGLVVHGDYLERVKQINTAVNEIFRTHLKIEDNFREIKLEEKDGGYVSKTPIIAKFLEESELNKAFLDEYPLYPDQLVYLNNMLVNSPETIQVKGKEVFYKTDLKQATTLEETLSAYLFIIYTLRINNLPISKMNEKEVAFINNWEAEKYRRSVK